jgi:hypothetical protein
MSVKMAYNVLRLGEGCLTESSKFAQISMAAFAKPLLANVFNYE